MILKKWEKLPEFMQNEKVRPYYDLLQKRWKSLFLKRIFDIIVSLIMLILLSPLFLVFAMLIKLDSKGPVFYRQLRITKYGEKFYIFKFRTMVQNADKGSLLTIGNDSRITRVGKLIRGLRLDEIPQLIDVFRGTMTFVGTRPEVPKYVEGYSPEMMATLLLPAGITNLACVYFKDEAKLLDGADDPDEIYINKVLKEKMYYNLKGIEDFSFWTDIKLMIMTALAVLGKEYKDEHKTNICS